MKTKIEYASFQLSDLGSNYYIAKRLFELQKEKPDYFVDGVKLEYMFGSWPSALWQGERPYMGFSSFEKIEKKIKDLKKVKANLYYTFNNRKLDKNDIYDNYCNLIMKKSDIETTVVEVYDSNLEKYIRDTYKNVKISKRITEKNFDEINKNKYDFYILDTVFNDDYEKLSTIKHPEKIIIVLNDFFKKGDPKYEKFLDAVSKSVKDMKSDLEFDIERFTEFNEMGHGGNLVEYYQVGRLLKLGISHFRIEGRSTAVQYYYIPSLFYYLIKEEYRGEVFEQLQQAFFSPITDMQKDIL